MEHLKTLIEACVAVTVFLTIFRVYFSTNSLWKRKHNREVVYSLSAVASAINVFGATSFILLFTMDRKWLPATNQILLFFLFSFQLIVALGIWVQGEKRQGFGQLIRKRLKLEAKESADLAKSFLKPPAAETVIEILAQIALIDEHLDEKEQQLINSFVDTWEIKKFSWEEFLKNRSTHSQVNFMKLRQDVEDYLVKIPGSEQVLQLQDVINTLINADQEVSEQEKLVQAEINGLFANYINETSASDNETYHVVVVARNAEQEGLIETSLPELSPDPLAVGLAYYLGPFHSKQYAVMVGERYRQLNLFSYISVKGVESMG
jgi:hypothetical protein